MAARILVVEDEAEIAALISYQLTRDGYRVETALNGAAALDALHRDLPDLVVLDRMLPGVSGDDMLKAVRSDPATCPRPDRQGGTGGPDPGDRAGRRRLPHQALQPARTGAAGGGRILRAGQLRVDVGTHIVTLGDEEIRLTPTEFRLLRTLMERRGRTQSRRQLLTEAWKMESSTAG